ncbi:hypothetical protein MRX96_032986 [Rhipicephalus microplus]
MGHHHQACHASLSLSCHLNGCSSASVLRSARANPRAATPSCSNIFSFLKCCGTRCIKEAGTLAQLTEAAQTGPVRSFIKRHRPHARFSALCELANCTGMTIQYGSRLSCSSAAASLSHGFSLPKEILQHFFQRDSFSPDLRRSRAL